MGVVRGALAFSLAFPHQSVFPFLYLFLILQIFDDGFCVVLFSGPFQSTPIREQVSQRVVSTQILLDDNMDAMPWQSQVTTD